LKPCSICLYSKALHESGDFFSSREFSVSILRGHGIVIDFGQTSSLEGTPS
jgi:hypothetical protein